MCCRVAPFRNKSVDKWQRKADVQSGAAAKKVKLLAFNQVNFISYAGRYLYVVLCLLHPWFVPNSFFDLQNISDQVATYMRDPSKMIRSMQTRRETVGVFGTVSFFSFFF